MLELNSNPHLELVQDLDEAMPAYYASIKALDSLDKKSIQEMKSFTNPPQVREARILTRDGCPATSTLGGQRT